MLHVPTLAMVAVFVTTILGALLLFAWRRDQSTDALAWWGVGYLVGGLSFALLSARGSIPDVLSIELANMFLLLGYSLLLAGARAFGGRETPVTVFLIAPLIGFALGALIQRIVIQPIRNAAALSIVATFGLSLILQESVRMTFGPTPRRILAPIHGTILLFGVNYEIYRLFAALIALAAIGGSPRTDSLGLF